MVFKDYYKILGLETNRVTSEEIKLAYRGEAKKYHPDLNVGNNLAEERIKDINEAYKILSIPSQKRKYDRKRNSYVGRKNNLFEKNGNSKQVLKNMFFGVEEEPYKKVENKKAKRGENVDTSMSVSIYEAFYGLEKKISLKTPSGKVRNLAVSIPKGIKQGEKIRLIGQGKQGENGGMPGDLFIKINIQDDNKFRLKGANLYTILKITPWEAALGKKVTIKSIDNEESKLYIPKGAESGDIVTIPGRGYTKNKTERGKLIVELRIMVPKKLTDEEKKLFEKLGKTSKFNPRNT